MRLGTQSESGRRSRGLALQPPGVTGFGYASRKGPCDDFAPSLSRSFGRALFVEPGRADPGRHDGIRKLRRSPYTLLGRFNDDAERATAAKTRYVRPRQSNFGEFRVPGLRNVALTAPYMHAGSLPTLADVARHYSTLDEERLHAGGERILRRLDLRARERADLVAFLETLTEEKPLHEFARKTAIAGCR